MTNSEERKYDSRQAEEYAEVLKHLAFYVGCGGYNADDPIDANVFKNKILFGIDQYINHIGNLRDQLREAHKLT